MNITSCSEMSPQKMTKDHGMMWKTKMVFIFVNEIA